MGVGVGEAILGCCWRREGELGGNVGCNTTQGLR